jgi:hypothetical protein
MKYALILELDNKPTCNSCILCNNGKCQTIATYPDCPYEGCRNDCPLKAIYGVIKDE